MKSNWGNELTADDIKWTWDRNSGLGAIGAFYLSTLGLENKDGVKVEGKYTVSISLDNPNPLLAKLQPNLFMPIYVERRPPQLDSQLATGTKFHLIIATELNCGAILQLRAVGFPPSSCACYLIAVRANANKKSLCACGESQRGGQRSTMPSWAAICLQGSNSRLTKACTPKNRVVD